MSHTRTRKHTLRRRSLCDRLETRRHLPSITSHCTFLELDEREWTRQSVSVPSNSSSIDAYHQLSVQESVRERKGLPVDTRDMGWRQERVLECCTIVLASSVSLHTRTCPRSRAVGRFRSAYLPQATQHVAARWFCEPAFERLRGTPDSIVNRYAWTATIALCPALRLTLC